MSTQNKLGKLITRFEIGFDNETKADIDALKAKIDELTRALSVKDDSHGDRLLAAMQAEAANDAPQPEFKYLGQWVFAGVDDKYQSAAMDKDGKVYLYECELNDLNKNTDNGHCYWWPSAGIGYIYVCTMRDGRNWEHYAIQRKTVNDVDYLSCAAPETHGMATFISIDEYESLSESVPHIDDVLDQPHWLSESVPQITQADMQLIFIKNLSETLIQRMHSMDRFSEDDYAIGGDKLMAWDIVANPKGDFAVITGHNQDKRYFGGLYFVPYARGNHAKTVSGERANEYLKTLEFCTITEDQLSAFRAALEACYA